MSGDKAIQFAKRYAVWAALVLSVAASWYVSQEDLQDQIAPEIAYLPPKKISRKHLAFQRKRCSI
jgi:hypothetical protein